jgi:phosphoserine phosphatase
VKFQLVLFDVDSTLIEQEVIDLLGSFTSNGDQIAHITDLAMKGEVNFDEALIQRVSFLKGLPDTIFNRVLNQITFSQGAQELLSKLKNAGYRVGIVSGGFHNVVDQLFSPFKLDFMRANTLEIEDGRLTGRILGPIVNRQAKAQALREFTTEQKIEISQTVAVGDGANDIEMIKLAGLGVSYHGKPTLNAVADVQINDGNLLELLDYL